MEANYLISEKCVVPEEWKDGIELGSWHHLGVKEFVAKLDGSSNGLAV